jgi:hypothetical protein
MLFIGHLKHLKIIGIIAIWKWVLQDIGAGNIIGDFLDI